MDTQRVSWLRPLPQSWHCHNGGGWWRWRWNEWNNELSLSYAIEDFRKPMVSNTRYPQIRCMTYWPTNHVRHYRIWSQILMFMFMFMWQHSAHVSYLATKIISYFRNVIQTCNPVLLFVLVVAGRQHAAECSKQTNGQITHIEFPDWASTWRPLRPSLSKLKEEHL